MSPLVCEVMSTKLIVTKSSRGVIKEQNGSRTKLIKLIKKEENEGKDLFIRKIRVLTITALCKI